MGTILLLSASLSLPLIATDFAPLCRALVARAPPKGTFNHDQLFQMALRWPIFCPGDIWRWIWHARRAHPQVSERRVRRVRENAFEANPAGKPTRPLDCRACPEGARELRQ